MIDRWAEVLQLLNLILPAVLWHTVKLEHRITALETELRLARDTQS